MVKNYAILILLTLLITISSVGQTQLKGWHVGTNLIDWRASTPVVKPAFSVNSAASQAYNSIYDSEGKLLLYITGTNVFNKFNQPIAYIPLGPTGTHVNFEVIPNPANGGCVNKYYVVYADGKCCGSPIEIKYLEIDMNLNSGLGGATATPITILSVEDGAFPSFATSKVVSGVRYLYVTGSNIAFQREIRKFNVTSTNITFSALLLNGTNGSRRAAELELSDAGDKLAWVENEATIGSPGVNDVNVAYLNPTTGLLASSTIYKYSTNYIYDSWKGIEFDKTGNKLYTTTPGTGIYVKDLTVASSIPPVLIAGTANFSTCMLEKSFNGNEIICANSSLGQIKSINTTTNAFTSWTLNYTLPAILNSFVIMPSQIDGENFDLTGTTNVDVDIFNATNGTWSPTSNPFLALQQNSYLGNLTVLPKVRVATAINMASGVNVINDNLNFEFHTNAEWNISAGANLTLNGGLLQAHPCGKMWRGISVNNNNGTTASSLKTQFFGAVNCKIYDALKAIEVNGNNATLLVKDNSYFNKNEKAIVLNTINPSLISIYNTRIYDLNPLKDQTKGQVRSSGGTTRYGITGIEVNNSGTSTARVNIGNITSTSNTFYYLQQAIDCKNSEVSIQNNTFNNADRSAILGITNAIKKIEVNNNKFNYNKNDTWLAFGFHLDFMKNTCLNTAEYCVRWSYNGGNILNVGLDSDPLSGNTFQNFGWGAVALSENQFSSTDIKIYYNKFLNAPYSGGVYISESTLASGQSYKGYVIEKNTFTNVQQAIKVMNVRGSSFTDNNWNGNINVSTSDFRNDIYNNTIDYVTNNYANTKGIQLENCPKNRIVTNTVTASNSTDWQNTGISITNCSDNLVKLNTVQAGAGIRMSLDVMGSNVLCNTLKNSAIGIEPGWSWLRSVGQQHGESGIRGRHNFFDNNSIDMQIYYSNTSQYQWICPNTTNIVYAPGGSYGTNIIYSNTEDSPCNNINNIAPPNGGGEQAMVTQNMPNNYNEDVATSQQLNKDFNTELELLKNNPNSITSSSNINKLAIAQRYYEDKDYVNAKNHLQQLSVKKHLLENNLATVLSILIDAKAQQRTVYTAAEKATLLTIAESDSRIGGQGVHYARAILLISDNLHFDDPYLTAPNMSNSKKLAKNAPNIAYVPLFSVFPNPASNAINISSNLENKTITVYNYLGQKVYTQISNSTNDAIDVSKWNKGVYVIELNDELNKKELQKFIKE